MMDGDVDRRFVKLEARLNALEFVLADTSKFPKPRVWTPKDGPPPVRTWVDTTFRMLGVAYRVVPGLTGKPELHLWGFSGLAPKVWLPWEAIDWSVFHACDPPEGFKEEKAKPAFADGDGVRIGMECDPKVFRGMSGIVLGFNDEAECYDIRTAQWACGSICAEDLAPYVPLPGEKVCVEHKYPGVKWYGSYIGLTTALDAKGQVQIDGTHATYLIPRDEISRIVPDVEEGK